MRSAEARFWERIEKTDACWLIGSVPSYREVRVGGAKIGAHRFAYELLVGPIPDGLVLDHLCRVPNCVNPDHLEPVSTGENIRRGNGVAAQNARKTHCVRDHAFTPDNTYAYNGKRLCRACARDNQARYRARCATKETP